MCNKKIYIGKCISVNKKKYKSESKKVYKIIYYNISKYKFYGI